MDDLILDFATLPVNILLRNHVNEESEAPFVTMEAPNYPPACIYASRVYFRIIRMELEQIQR